MSVPSFTTPPEAPNRQQPTVFATNMDAFLSWLVSFASDLTTAVSWIGEKTAAVEAAAGGATADPWVSGGTYAVGESYYSPATFQSYRAKTNHSGLTTDPSLDDTNWAVYTLSSSPTLVGLSVSGDTIFGGKMTETVTALSGAAPDVDLSDGTIFTLTTSANTTLTFSNPAATGATSFTLILTAGGTHTLTWPAPVNWAGGAAPDAPASGETNVYTFLTVDAGATWLGFVSGEGMS